MPHKNGFCSMCMFAGVTIKVVISYHVNKPDITHQVMQVTGMLLIHLNMLLMFSVNLPVLYKNI